MESEPILILKGDNLGFGPIRSDLVETYMRWMNDLRVTRTLSAPRLPYTKEKEDEWLRGALTQSGDAVFTMYELATMRPIGNVGLHSIDHDSGTAEFGILIGETDVWGKGYGTEATRMMIGYGFDVLGLYNVQLEAFSHNPGALKAYERAGFRRIGVRRGAKRVGRERVDIVFMDVVADEVEPSPLHTLMQTGHIG